MSSDVLGKFARIRHRGGGRRVWIENPEGNYNQYDDYLRPGEEVLALLEYVDRGMCWLVCLSRLGIGWIGSQVSESGWDYLDK